MRFLAGLVAVLVLFLALVVLVIPPASAHNHNRLRSGAAGLANATVLIVRHAEKADRGPGLSPAGELRAQAYARYFRPFVLGRERLRIDTLIATADSHGSHRARLTLEPLSRLAGIPIQQPFDDRDVRDLATWLGQGPPRRTILIAWHHGKLPRLLRDLGLDPTTVLPEGEWPAQVYNWVAVLRFDRNGVIMRESCRLIHEPTPLQ